MGQNQKEKLERRIDELKSEISYFDFISLASDMALRISDFVKISPVMKEIISRIDFELSRLEMEIKAKKRKLKK